LETDILKSGNVLHNIPEKLPLKREKLIPLNLTDYQMKCSIWSQKLKSMSSGSNLRELPSYFFIFPHHTKNLSKNLFIDQPTVI